MRIEVLIATMHQEKGDYSLLNRMGITTDAIVINQCNRDSREIIQYNNHDVLWINTTERGLSRSRNKAIENATGDYCVLADDDEVLSENLETVIMRAVNDDPEVDVFRFQIHGIEDFFKEYSSEKYQMMYLQTMKASSVELVFKRSSIYMNKIKFDEYIGAGTKYVAGEENAFLWLCLRKGLKILAIPKKIADLHIGNSTWFKGYNSEYLIGKGAAFTAMSRKWAFFLIAQFAIRRRMLYKDNMSVIDATKHMLEGRKEYLQDISQEEG